MNSTADLLPPFQPPTYDNPEELIRAYHKVLRLLRESLASMPDEDASDEDLKQWAQEVLDKLESSKTDPELLGGYGEYLWSWVAPIVNPILDVIRGTISSVERTAKKARDELSGLIDKVETRVDTLENAIANKVYEAVHAQVVEGETIVRDIFGTLTEPLKKELHAAVEVFEIAFKLKEKKILDTKQRIIWVADALAFVLRNEEISALITDIGTILEAEKNDDRITAFGDFVETIVVDSSPMLSFVKLIVSWISDPEKFELPHFGMGLTPGRLYEFLNGTVVNPVDGKEREFRIELVSALDRYFHGEYEVPQLAAMAGRDGNNSNGTNNTTLHEAPRQTHSVDSKLAIQTLTDVIRIVLQTSFGFVFRAPHLPSLMAPKMSLLQPSAQLHHQPHLVAAKHASATMSRAISAPIKAVSGLLFRGVWEVNAHNEALVELVASTISEIIGSITGTLTYSLFSLLEIREVYDDPKDINRCLLSWNTRAEWAHGNTTFQAVVVVKGMLGNAALENDFFGVITGLLEDAKNDKDKNGVSRVSMIENLLKDYGAYLELSRDCHEPDLTDNSITVDLKPSADSVLVTATFTDTDKDLPVVLRVYADGQHKIMGKDHTAELANLTKGALVHVLAGKSAHGQKQY